MKAWETGVRAPAPPPNCGWRFEDLDAAGPEDAEDLRRLRESLGWTRVEAARRLGIDPSAPKRVEAGVELPPDPKVMARVYGLTAAEIAAVVRRTG